jgi:hypothetical protein
MWDEQQWGDEGSPLEELRRRLGGPGRLRQARDRTWGRRFRRLAEAVARVEDTACGECEALLDVYVEAELAGQDVQQRYPTLWGHLQSCDACAVAHDLLFETLARERRGALEPLPPAPLPRLSFLEPPAPDAPWAVRLRSRLTGAPFGITFTLSPAYLRSFLTAPQPLPARTRQADRVVEPRVLLADTVSLGEGVVAVEVTAIPDERDPDRLHLRATIAGPGDLPRHLWAVLRWGDETRSGAVDAQGQVDLGQVSLAALERALEAGEGTFEIAFEERRET